MCNGPKKRTDLHDPAAVPRQANDRDTRWKPPTRYSYKLNVDALIYSLVFGDGCLLFVVVLDRYHMHIDIIVT